MGDVTPPPLQGPTSKERKYDRQLRLWAANGQAALEDAHILLINSGPGVVGVEALKNLILPGVGNFTILDSALVTEADLGVNFFLEDSDLGKFRAESCCKWLQELNPDVQGHFINEPVETFINRPDALTPYNLILLILPALPELQAIVRDFATSAAVPAFYIHSVGFYSHFSLQLPRAFPIVDTHPDPATTTDLRLLQPWPELLDFATNMAVDLDKLDNEEHGHVPYVVLLLHYLQEWSKANDGKLPENYREKTAFREMVRKGTRTNNPEGGEENFDEAVAAVLKSLNPSTASSAVREVFEAEECRRLHKNMADFWLIARAIHDFYTSHDSILPLSGTLPDMKAKSATYIQLQNLYKAKARDDAAEVLATVRGLEDELGRVERKIDAKEVAQFCKSAGYVKLVRGREPHVSTPGQLIQWKDRAKWAVNALTNPDSLLPLYIAFQAYDSYAAAHPMSLPSNAEGKINMPGTQHATVERETAPETTNGPSPEALEVQASKITGIAYTLIDDLINQPAAFIEDPEYSEVKATVENIVKELVRAQGAELHNVAAATGGIVAQEAIKVLTKQYIPVDNTCLFDMVRSITEVIRI